MQFNVGYKYTMLIFEIHNKIIYLMQNIIYDILKVNITQS
jgi:hypothetical protein